MTESKDNALKLEWDLNTGCYATVFKAANTENQVHDCFKSVISLMQNKRFHVVDIIFPHNTLGIPLQTHVNALLYELKGLRDSVDQVNVINRSKKQPTRHNYIKVVRLFITSDEYCAFENEYASSNRRNDEVVGSKPNVKDVMKTVMQDMSSIEAILKFTIKIKHREFEQAMKKLKKMQSDQSKENQLVVTVDKKMSLVTCEGKKSLIDKAKEELEKYKETEICLEMNEDDYTALLYITSEDTWRGGMFDIFHMQREKPRSS
ncbi:unnamed protein product [Mytilus edulis]|uniref:Uncharacterized protein n=1 Tax=Mytilus edulis TaxID=6550 RepID=A0A8S3V8U7_MYTED|nr:unnamed protein product [Mytilus edulis]